MMTRDYISELFLILAVINAVLFVFLLLKKIILKAIQRKKEKIRSSYEKGIIYYINTERQSRLIKPKCYLSKKVLKELILEYGALLKDEKKHNLVDLIEGEKLVESIKKNIRSKNKLKRRIGAYEAGEFDVKELLEDLTGLLYEDDRELVYIVSKSLLKLEGRAYLDRILERISCGEIMEKSNSLSLMDYIEEDIEDMMIEIMEGYNIYLQAIALEVCGKRQYTSIVSWIKKMMNHSVKEIRISSLKGALYLKDFPYDRYGESIVKLKDDSEWEVRLFVAKNLRKLDNEESLKALKKLIKDPNWLVRHSSALSLLKQGDRGLYTLIGMIDSEDAFARDKAKEVLQKEIMYNHLLEGIKYVKIRKYLEKKMEMTILGESLQDEFK